MKMKLLASVALAGVMIGAAPSHANMLFTVPSNVSEGHLNVRNGPGVNHGLIGAIPGGQTVSASRCAPRDDGISGANWCFVTWNGMQGWASQAGLMPVPMAQAAPPPSHAGLALAQCGAPTVDFGDDPHDHNPVVSADISYDSESRVWQIFYHLADGQTVSRAQQYGITDVSNQNENGWQGHLLRNPYLYMDGRMTPNGYYEEWLYDQGKGRLVMHMGVQCYRVNSQAAAPPPVPSGTVLQGYPPPAALPPETYDQDWMNRHNPVTAPAAPAAPTTTTAGGTTVIVVPR
jgi:hypothetical protein